MMYRIYWLDGPRGTDRVKCSLDVERSRLHEKIDEILHKDYLITGLYVIPEKEVIHGC